MAYRVYVTEALKSLARMNISYADMLDSKEPDTRTGEEVVADIKRGLAKIGN